MTIRSDYLPFGKPNFSDGEIAAVSRVLRSGWVGMGPETIAFEKELASFLGAPYVVAVNSCTSALFLSLLVHGVGQGDEVICPSLTWCSTANVALFLGATPVFCDVDPDTLCVTPEAVSEKLSPRTRAVMVVHFGGLPAPVREIRAVLPDGVAVIEDAAHALGSRFADGTPVGGSGNLTCFSFYANKNLSTGEGGAVALFDEALYGRIRSLRLHAMPVDAWKRFSSPKVLLKTDLSELGYKMNYTDLQASLGRVQLARQPELSVIRLGIARQYADFLSSLKPPVRLQEGILAPGHSRHLFVVQFPTEELGISRDDLVVLLRARNVGASIHYAPLHRMPLYAGSGPARPLPVTDAVCERILTLPFGAGMDRKDADYVITQLREVLPR
ncbi:MAG: DegT/DnrJ/EryC1/StrS family aminotransferase [bacterium]|jgi:dTDP-4-amino-4,6-dideoxygalactose transaminase